MLQGEENEVAAATKLVHYLNYVASEWGRFLPGRVAVDTFPWKPESQQRVRRCGVLCYSCRVCDACVHTRGGCDVTPGLRNGRQPH